MIFLSYFWPSSVPLDTHEIYIHRCLELARLGTGDVAPNPMVGAILVYDGRVIGEGYHERFGHAHAEVNCLASVKEEDRHCIDNSTMYVSLEPCTHFGKTPPCTDLILENKINKVVIGCRDPFPEVNGKGIEKLMKNGVDVITDVLSKDCETLNKRFFTFHREHRPYIVLKWAETGNGKIANEDYSRILISNELTNRLVHKWRSEESSILVGTNTALFDDPQLNNRLWYGQSPVRMVIDLELRLPLSLKIFDQEIPTIVFNTRKHEEHPNLIYYQVGSDANLVHQVVHALYQLKIQSVLIEGGARLLQSFIDEEFWDETRVITNTRLHVSNGLPSPVMQSELFIKVDKIDTDTIHYYSNKKFN